MLSMKVFYSNATETVLENDINAQIEKWSAKYELAENVVRAVIATESSYQPWALRYEPHLKKTTWYTNAVPDEQKSNDYAYFSMGLMQVLYGVAVDLGFKGTPFELMDPTNSIQYGCKHLANLKRRWPDITDYISAYNQGSPRKTEEGLYQNQAYVEKVMAQFSD